MRGRIDRIDVERGGRRRWSTTTRHSSGAAGRNAGWARATSRSRCTCAPRRSCSGSRRSAASTSRSRASICARAGCWTAKPEWSSTACVSDVREPRGSGDARRLRSTTAREAGAPQAGAGALEPRPNELRLQRWLQVPVDLPLRGVSVRGLPVEEHLDEQTPSGEEPGAHGKPAGAPELTDEQKRAGGAAGASRCCSRPGAGSGKTSVLVERFVSGGARGRDRAGERSSPSRSPSGPRASCASGSARGCSSSARARLARDTEAAFVGTFHGFCARLLRAHPLPAGLDPDFAILDEPSRAPARSWPSRSRSRAFLGRAQPAEGPSTSSPPTAPTAWRTMIEHGPRRAAQPRSAPPAPARAPGAAREREAEDLEAVAALAAAGRACWAPSRAAYEALKRERRAVDFDDLELMRARSARRPRRRCAARGPSASSC